MGEFKNIVSEYVGRFLKQYQEKRDSYTDEKILEFISKGNDIAKTNAEETLKAVRSAMGMKYTSGL
jgi:tryptophanyl-tRNA synthetase